MGSNAFATPASIGLPGDRVFAENITSTKDGTHTWGVWAVGHQH
jgi:hypothetical protein